MLLKWFDGRAMMNLFPSQAFRVFAARIVSRANSGTKKQEPTFNVEANKQVKTTRGRGSSPPSVHGSRRWRWREFDTRHVSSRFRPVPSCRCSWSVVLAARQDAANFKLCATIRTPIGRVFGMEVQEMSAQDPKAQRGPVMNAFRPNADLTRIFTEAHLQHCQNRLRT